MAKEANHEELKPQSSKLNMEVLNPQTTMKTMKFIDPQKQHNTLEDVMDSGDGALSEEASHEELKLRRSKLNIEVLNHQKTINTNTNCPRSESTQLP